MEFLERVKTMTREQVANAMLEIITHVSPETFMALSIMSSYLVQGDQANAAVEAVKESLQQGENGQATKLFRRVMTELSPHCLKAVARALFINGLLKSSSLRAEFEKQEGYAPPFTILISPTMQCNLECTGCYSGKYVREKGLSYELIDRLLTEAYEMGVRFIVFSGGEPLTRRDDLLPLDGRSPNPAPQPARSGRVEPAGGDGSSRVP